LEQFCASHGIPLNDRVRAEIDERVRRAAYQIISGKGATYYGIGSALARITEAILGNQRAVLTVCSRQSHIVGVEDVTLALPQLVGGDGILDTYIPPLSEDETGALEKSARVIRDAIDSLHVG
jgi:L-lactate dehydrogenase